MLFDHVFIVESIDSVLVCLTASRRVRLANDLAQHIYLRLELVDGFFRVLGAEGFLFLSLPCDELGLAGLEIFVVALIQVVLVSEHFACVGDRRVESVRV